jgi:hypothetical protein
MPKHVIPPDSRITVGPFSEVVTLDRGQRQQFLSMIAEGASMHHACRELKVPLLAVGRALGSDEEFAADFEVAKTLRNMALENVLIEQSTVGIDEVLTHQGRISYEYTGEYELDENGEVVPGAERTPVTVKKLVTSNASLLAILKANYPDKYRERSEVITREGALAPERITSDDDRSKLIALLRKRAALRSTKPDPDEDLL